MSRPPETMIGLAPAPMAVKVSAQSAPPPLTPRAGGIRDRAIWIRPPVPLGAARNCVAAPPSATAKNVPSWAPSKRSTAGSKSTLSGACETPAAPSRFTWNVIWSPWLARAGPRTTTCVPPLSGSAVVSSWKSGKSGSGPPPLPSLRVLRTSRTSSDDGNGPPGAIGAPMAVTAPRRASISGGAGAIAFAERALRGSIPFVEAGAWVADAVAPPGRVAWDVPEERSWDRPGRRSAAGISRAALSPDARRAVSAGGRAAWPTSDSCRRAGQEARVRSAIRVSDWGVATALPARWAHWRATPAATAHSRSASPPPEAATPSWRGRSVKG